MNIIDTIHSYLIGNGVSEFWSASQAAQIGRVLAGNKYFVSTVSNPSVKVCRAHAKRFACDAVVILPDYGQRRPARILYRFNPNRPTLSRTAHYVEIKLTPNQRPAMK